MANQTSYADVQERGFAGMAPTPDRNEYLTLKNMEATASIPMGSGVKFDLSSPVSDLDALLPAAETDVICGIVAYSTTYARSWTDSNGVINGDLDSTGLRPNALMAVATRGRLLVLAEDAVAVGDHLWVRATVGGPGEVLGGLLNADEGTETIDCTNQGMWLTSAAAGKMAWLQFDFTGDAT